jgi:hypothetical protein
MLAHAIDSVARFLPERGGAAPVPTAQTAPVVAPAMTASATPPASPPNCSPSPASNRVRASAIM